MWVDVDEDGEIAEMVDGTNKAVELADDWIGVDHDVGEVAVLVDDTKEAVELADDWTGEDHDVFEAVTRDGGVKDRGLRSGVSTVGEAEGAIGGVTADGSRTSRVELSP